jgi:hypothetical protein
MLLLTPIDHAKFTKTNFVQGYMRRQLPLILANSITTNKSQSMTAHNGIVYEPQKTKPFARGLP